MTASKWKVPGLFASLLAVSNAQATGFSACDDARSLPGLHGTLCATELVPASHDTARAAATGTLTLFVRKFPSPRKARGAVWLVAGGPGESGASLYPMIGVLRRSFPDFDLIVPDHRGSGYSTRLCPDEEAAGSPGGMALDGAEWGSCFGRLNSGADQARQFSITNAAHDLKLLIERNPSRRPVYVYAVSYGTQLVLRTLQLGKLPVAGVILDSLVPLQAAPEWDLSRRSFVVDDVGRKVLAQCDATPDCRKRLGEPAENALRGLLDKGAGNPLLLADVPGKNLKRFLGNLLDVPAARERIPYLVKELGEGRRDELKAVLAGLEHSLAGFAGYPQSPVSIPLVSLISSSENNLRPALTNAVLEQEDEQLLFTSSLPEYLVSPALPVYDRDQYFGKLPAQFPPMLVLQGTLDPKTHYAGALEHIAALRGTGKVGVVSVMNAPHFILWTAPACFEQAARDFVAGRRRCVLPAARRRLPSPKLSVLKAPKALAATIPGAPTTSPHQPRTGIPQ